MVIQRLPKEGKEEGEPPYPFVHLPPECLPELYYLSSIWHQPAKALKRTILEGQAPGVGIRAKERRNGCVWEEQAKKPAQMARNLQTLLCRAVNQVRIFMAKE